MGTYSHVFHFNKYHQFMSEEFITEFIQDKFFILTIQYKATRWEELQILFRITATKVVWAIEATQIHKHQPPEMTLIDGKSKYHRRIYQYVKTLQYLTNFDIFLQFDWE